MAKENDDFFNDENIAQSNWFSFENVGDKISGTYVGHRHQAGVGQYPDQEIYELKTSDESIWNVGFSVNKTYIINRIKNIKFGQKIGFMFKDEIPSKTKGYAPAKSIEVYAGDIDPEYKEREEQIDKDLNSALDGVEFDS